MKLTRRKLFKLLGIGAAGAVVLPLAKISLPPEIKAIPSPKKTGNRMLTNEEFGKEALKVWREALALSERNLS